MPRRSFSPKALKPMSIRLQRAIDGQYGSLYQLQQQLRADGKAPLASTVRGWLPPQDRWAMDPETGSKVRALDWQGLRAPDLVTLAEFCEYTQLRVDYVLFGDGPAFRHETAEVRALEAALVDEALKRLPERSQILAKVQKPDGGRLIDLAAGMLAEEALATEQFNNGLRSEVRRAAQSLLGTFMLAEKEGSGVSPVVVASRFADEVLSLLMWVDKNLPEAKATSQGLVLIPWREVDGSVTPKPALARDATGKLTVRVRHGVQIAVWTELAYLNVPKKVLAAIKQFTNDFRGWSAEQAKQA